MTHAPAFEPPLKVYYSPAYAVDTGIETVTKSRALARLVVAGEAGRVDIRKPAPATEAELRSVHTARYVAEILEGTTGHLEAGPWSPALRDSVLATNGGMRAAALAALSHGRSGSFSSGLHHAKSDAGEAFCTVNGLALAAIEALAEVERVGILDLDAHYGGGTAEILKDNPRVVLSDVSTSRFDEWQPTSAARHHVETVTRGNDYLDAARRALPILRGCDLILYNAGMDIHEKAGGIPGIGLDTVQERERLVVAWAAEQGIPIAFALAGGYTWGGLTLEELARLHLETVKAFARP